MVRTTGIITISVVAAAVIFTGCGSSSSNGGGGSGTTPESLTQEVTVTNETGAQVMALLPNAMGVSPLSEVQADMATKVAELKESAGTNEEGSYDCDISGSYSYKYNYSESESADGTYSYEDNYSYSYDNCVDNTSYGYSEGTYNLITYDGDGVYKYTRSYNPDSNLTKYKRVSSDNYSYTYEDNTTGWTKEYVYQLSYNQESTSEGEYYIGFKAPAPINGTFSSKNDGLYSRLSMDENGTVYEGYKYEYVNLIETGSVTENEESTTLNGSYARYDVNETGDHMTEGFFYKDFVVETVESGYDTNLTANGTMGNSCLGGAVKITTTATVQMNDVNFTNSCDGSSYNTLPYAGVVTLDGNGSATLTSDNNGTHTTLTVTSDANGTTESTFNCWDDVYDIAGTCGMVD